MTALCRLDGKISLITGASSGIGQGTAILFSKLGARLSITGRNEENLTKTAHECEKQSGLKPLTVVADLAKEEDTRRVIEETIRFYGTLNILVNNAGMATMGGIETLKLEQYDEVMNLNTRSIFHITKLAVPYLSQSKGCIVNVSTIVTVNPVPQLLAYGMSKSALDFFTKNLAAELAPKNIRVNSVNPGFIPTEIYKRMGMDEESYQYLLERCKYINVLGRPGEVNEVADLIAFLSSDNSSFITGANIPIDGGAHIMTAK